MNLESYRIVALDDDEFVLQTLAHQLEKQGCECVPFSDTSAFLDSIGCSDAFDAVILDYHLPPSQGTGLDICRNLKARFRKPVIMLTGDCATETIVACLNAGADQYVVKPYNIAELVARISAACRTYSESTGRVSAGQRLPYDVRINWRTRMLSGKHDLQQKLTEKELALLELFMASADGHIDRARSFSVLYGYEMEPMNRSIDILVSRLRKKLRRVLDGMEIATVRGSGYRIGFSNAENVFDEPSAEQ
jgi:two-component system OmpR family response regulator